MVKFTISNNEYKIRVENVRRELVERSLDALYLTSRVSIFYLTGFSHIPTERPAALVIPVDGLITFMGPILEADHVHLKTRIIESVKAYFDYPGEKHPINRFVDFLTQMNLHTKKIGADNLAGAAGTWGYEGPAISERLRKAKMILAKDIVGDMRLIKSEEEIQLIRESVKWANLAHSLLQEYSEVGLWDLDVA
ncbi:MAG: aminopeptidase P family N-terminal domain-containing protein, partial [Candidatus Bathyarchaeota archaeon]